MPVSENAIGRAISDLRDPEARGAVSYVIVGLGTPAPEIREVDGAPPGSYPTLQEAKSRTMAALQEQIASAKDSLARIRATGVVIGRRR